MPNFFSENEDILFHFKNLKMENIVELTENFYEESKEYNYAPINYTDAMENYQKILEIDQQEKFVWKNVCIFVGVKQEKKPLILNRVEEI